MTTVLILLAVAAYGGGVCSLLVWLARPGWQIREARRGMEIRARQGRREYQRAVRKRLRGVR